MTYMAMPQHKNPCPGCHEIYNFVKPFLGNNDYTLSLSDLCLGAQKRIFKEIIHSHYMIYMTMPQHKNTYPKGCEIYNFCRHLLGHYYQTFTGSLSDLCLGVVKKFLKEIMHFHYSIYMTLPWNKISSPGCRKIYNFVSPCLGHPYLYPQFF